MKKLIHFIHNQKTAGMSMRKHMKNNGIKIPSSGHNRLVKVYDESRYYFGVVRHPVSRLISAYRFTANVNYIKSLCDTEEMPTFDSFVLRLSELVDLLENTGLMKFVGSNKQVDMYCDYDGALLADKLIDFDYVEAEYFDFLAQLGVEHDGVLPHEHLPPEDPPVPEVSADIAEVIINLFPEDYLLWQDVKNKTYAKGKIYKV